MFASGKSRGLVPLLALLICLLFLFPVKVGSFQATHGPTTTLEESLFFLVLQISLLLFGIASLSIQLLTSVDRCFGMVERDTGHRTTNVNAPISLRC
jgi:hypothetical protein